MKIGDFAKYNQISIQALRYYEKIDLIHPIAIDPFTNYRFYHIKQSAVIDNIQFFQQLNFSLAEIKHMMDDTKNPTMLNQLIENKKEELRHELSQLDQQLKEIEAFQDGAFIYQAKKECNEIELLEFPTRWILTHPTTQNIYEMSEDEYEFSLREFKSERKNLRKFNRVGSIMSHHSFAQETFQSKEFFMFSDKKTSRTKSLRKGTHATFYCHSFREEIEQLPRFKKALALLDYQITGDYICEVLYENNKTSDMNRSMFIRMQIPVKKRNEPNISF